MGLIDSLDLPNMGGCADVCSDHYRERIETAMSAKSCSWESLRPRTTPEDVKMDD